VLVLVIGDLHVPFRSSGLSSKFSRLLVPGKIQQVLRASIHSLADLMPSRHRQRVRPRDVRVPPRRRARCPRGTRGLGRGASPQVCLRLTAKNPNFPPSLVVQHGPIRIGVIHGHQAVPLGDAESLAAIARKMDVDVLVSGATHRCAMRLT